MSRSYDDAVHKVTDLQARVLHSTASKPEEIAEAAGVGAPTAQSVLGWLANKGLVEEVSGRWYRTGGLEPRKDYRGNRRARSRRLSEAA